MTQTMEQARAADAWRCSQGRPDAYTNVAKGAPALIMNSGLMQTIAYFERKGGREQASGEEEILNGQLRRWLSRQYPELLPKPEYDSFMQALFELNPTQFQTVTTEAMAWLRWLRQIAPSRRADAGA